MPYWASSPFGSCTSSNEFELMTVEKNDPASIKTLVGQGTKVIASIGGWNFPSSYFSKMVASSESRQKFISSAKKFIAANGMKGIDIDWEFPCSEKRTNPVKITCDKFRDTEDAGGNCPADKNNLPIFLKELREGLGDDMYISVASQAGKKHWENENLAQSTPYIDHWNLMNYDYMVPDIADGAAMSPNAPLYTPSAANTVQMSIDYTVQGYKEAGVPASKMMLGIPMYGHTWFSEGMSGSSWQKFGNSGTSQGKCCGPFTSTYGAKPGKGCGQCGVMMFSEIRAAGCDTYFDNETQSDVMYCKEDSADGYTEAGTWITYNGKKSIAALTKYSMDQGMGGVFVFDTSMDTLSYTASSSTLTAEASVGGEFTFEIMNQIADQLDSTTPPAPSPSPVPAPVPTPVPSPVPSPTPSPSGATYGCVNGQCVARSGGVDGNTCLAICTPPSTYVCTNDQCVGSSSGGVSKEVCDAICGSSFI